MKVALLNKTSKQLAIQLYIDFQLSGRGFKYITLKYLATVQVTITEINTNMYENAVNKHACPTDATLHSIAI